MTLTYNVVQDLRCGIFPLEKMLNVEKKKLVELPIVGMLINHIQNESLFKGLSTDMIFSFTLKDPVSLTIKYNANKYDQSYIEAISGHYVALLNNLIINSDKQIDEIEIIANKDSQRIIDAVQDYTDKLIPIEKYIPASFHQERLWFIDKFERGYLYQGGPIYHNISLVFEFAGSLNPSLLRESLLLLIARHDALRTQIVSTEKGLMQKIVPVGKMDFTLEYLVVNDSAADLFMEREITTPFELDKTLFRFVLVKTGNERHKLSFTIHHIIADRYSTFLLTNEMFLFYRLLLNGEPVQIKELPIQYGGFSLWQQQSLPEMEMNMLSYWKLQLEGKLKVLKLPSYQPRPAIHSYAGKSTDLFIPAELTFEIQKYNEVAQVGNHIILMAAFKVLLHKYAQQEEIVIGTSIDNRVNKMVKQIVGPIDNLIVVRSFINDEQCFNDCVTALSHTYKNGICYGMMPFDRLVKELAPEKDMSRTALFDVLFQYWDEVNNIPNIEGLAISPTHANLGYGKYDLNLFLQKQGDAIKGKLVYNALYYHSLTMDSMANYYLELLGNLLSHPKYKLSLIGMLPENEKKALLNEFDYTNINYPECQTLTALFTEQVRRTPENIAVKYEDQSISYQELDKLSNKLAFILRQNGVRLGTIVGLLMDRSINTITGILAILKSGGAYLPIDTDYPDERIAYFIQDSGIEFILTTSEFKDKVHTHCSIILIDSPEEQADLINEIKCAEQPSDLCYIIYTSGTTGKPKGVMIEHKNVVRLFFNDGFQFNFGSEDVWTMFHSHCFDFSVWEIFGALLFGGKLIIIPKMVARDAGAYLNILKTENVTVLNQTPGSFYNLIREDMLFGDDLSKLKYVILGGEALSPGKLKQWRQKYPQVCLINMFGITETTVHVTYKEIGEYEIENNISNIGKPIPTLSVYIFDKNQQPVPKGAIGELYVGGAGVARGYLGNRISTEKRFIRNPHNPQERLYRSGDLVKRLISGDIEFVERIDNQVQIRGFRIEPAEIEMHLTVHDKIKDAVVIGREKNGNKYLVAYYISAEKIPSAELRSYLLERLPDSMVPSYFMDLKSMPLTQNGKLDRDALPEPEIKSKEEYTAPTNEVEEILTDIWEEVLGIDKVAISINSNFFDLGGHSLLAPILISMISERLKFRFHLKILYQYPTIAAFALYFFENVQTDS